MGFDPFFLKLLICMADVWWLLGIRADSRYGLLWFVAALIRWDVSSHSSLPFVPQIMALMSWLRVCAELLVVGLSGRSTTSCADTLWVQQVHSKSSWRTGFCCPSHKQHEDQVSACTLYTNYPEKQILLLLQAGPLPLLLQAWRSCACTAVNTRSRRASKNPYVPYN